MEKEKLSPKEKKVLDAISKTRNRWGEIVVNTESLAEELSLSHFELKEIIVSLKNKKLLRKNWKGYLDVLDWLELFSNFLS